MDKAVGGLQGLGIAVLRLVWAGHPLKRATVGRWRNCRGEEKGGKGIAIMMYRVIEA